MTAASYGDHRSTRGASPRPAGEWTRLEAIGLPPITTARWRTSPPDAATLAGETILDTTDRRPIPFASRATFDENIPMGIVAFGPNDEAGWPRVHQVWHTSYRRDDVAVVATVKDAAESAAAISRP